MTTRALIRGAIPLDTAKTITAELGCTLRQGRRIAGGEVPRRFRAALLRLLDEHIDRREMHLRGLREELARIEHARSVAAHRGLAGAVVDRADEAAAEAGADGGGEG